MGREWEQACSCKQIKESRRRCIIVLLISVGGDLGQFGKLFFPSWWRCKCFSELRVLQEIATSANLFSYSFSDKIPSLILWKHRICTEET